MGFFWVGELDRFWDAERESKVKGERRRSLGENRGGHISERMGENKQRRV